ncbi:Abc transporter-like protein, partial [Globisporangium polare]
MGPSGGGKTTLLDILADRVCSGTIEGRIDLNGAKRETRAFRAVARHVAQEDTLLGSFTVLETLEMAAKLSLPSSITNAMVRERVQTVLDDMGLRNCMHTLVGDIFRKGISGGQKRRLSMAIELLSNPSILLLDEPTSGLDSASTFSVMKLVQNLCQQQSKTVICTIHQPSSLVYDMFTNIVILSAGETVYCGPRVDMIAHFASAGYQCPAYSNPVEHFIELVNADFTGHGDIPALLAAYQQSSIASTVAAQTAGDRANAGATVKTRPRFSFAGSKDPASPRRQFLVLFHRNSLNNIRNPGIFWVRLVMYVALGTMVGTMYLSTNKDITDNDIAVLLFGAHAFFVFMSVAVVPLFIEERGVFLRERTNSSLNIGSFVAANFLAAVPGIFLIALIVACIVVFLVGLKCFGYYLLNLFLSMLVAESMMRVIGASCSHGIIGLIVGASIFGVFMLCEGFMIPKRAIPNYWIWGYYLGFHTYAFETFMHKQFMPNEVTIGTPVPAILTRMGLTEVQPDRNMGILLG